MMNLSSMIGSEPLSRPTHSTDICILHYISVIHDALQSTFKCTHFGFAPGIYFPDFEEQPQEEFYVEEYIGACAN